MRREDDQKLWDLLGRAAEPVRLSDFFGRNVVREICQKPRRFEWPQTWFGLRRLIPAAVAAIILIVATVAIEHPFWRSTATAENTPDVITKIDPQDFEVVADLDVLIASDETSLWDEDQSL